MTGWHELLVLPALLSPVVVFAVFLLPRSGEGPRRLLPVASLPALALALLPDAGAPITLVLPSFLLGATFEADTVARTLLLLIGLAWSTAAWFAADRLTGAFRGFALFWLAALTGLMVATLAADLVTFYSGYVLMTLAAYGLVIHERNPAALRAGRIYLVLALGGEAFILSGLLLVGARVGNAALATLPEALGGADATVAAALLMTGFAVKIGVVPLHVWLPVAHPVAPVPASAILSGVLVKAGLLGALRTVPADAFGAPQVVTALVALGLFTALYGAAMGICQTRVKTILAYSTVSQMGLLFAALVPALTPGSSRGSALIALLVLHHGLNKAALFLAAGSSPGTSAWRLSLLALPAASIAGLPLTTGELAKGWLKDALDGAVSGAWVAGVLVVSSIATALLMLRVLHVARQDARGERNARPVHPAWWLLVVLGAVAPWWQAWNDGIARLPDLDGTWASLWPPALAGLLYWIWLRLGAPASTRRVPEGDLIAPAGAAIHCLGRLVGRGLLSLAARVARFASMRDRLIAAATGLGRMVQRLESALSALPVAGIALLAIAWLVWAALAF